mmetsp:Transcript_102629/g.296727  ORF Transcript_102629/g.296727 Transcript_102629/m.296727 type:complete len:234 (-) Transcript_102629:965-1666(-)
MAIQVLPMATSPPAARELPTAMLRPAAPPLLAAPLCPATRQSRTMERYPRAAAGRAAGCPHAGSRPSATRTANLRPRPQRPCDPWRRQCPPHPRTASRRPRARLGRGSRVSGRRATPTWMGRACPMWPRPSPPHAPGCPRHSRHIPRRRSHRLLGVGSPAAAPSNIGDTSEHGRARGLPGPRPRSTTSSPLTPASAASAQAAAPSSPRRSGLRATPCFAARHSSLTKWTSKRS